MSSDEKNEGVASSVPPSRPQQEPKPKTTAPVRQFDCTSCAHYQPGDIEQPKAGGTCHRHPPSLILLGVHQGRPPAFQPAADLRGFWPVVGIGDWCGDHTTTSISLAQPAVAERKTKSEVAP